MEIKVYYYIDDQNTPYLTKLNVNGSPCLKDFKNALGRNCSKYKFFFATNDPSIRKVKEEIINDEQILPFDTGNCILAYLISIEGSTTSSGGDGEGEGNQQSKYSNYHLDDTILSSITNSSFNIQQPHLQCMSQCYASANNSDNQKYFSKQRAGRIDVTSFSSSDSESTTFLDETGDYGYSMVNDSTTIASRYHGRNRLRGRQHRSPSGLNQVLLSGFNPPMALKVITIMLNLNQVNCLGINITSQIHDHYIHSIIKGGAVEQDGRIEPGDMILQVNDISFEGLSCNDVAKILREAVQKHGPIKLIVAKCWDSTLGGYITLPRHEQVRPVDSLSRLEHTQAVQNTYNNSCPTNIRDTFNSLIRNNIEPDEVAQKLIDMNFAGEKKPELCKVIIDMYIQKPRDQYFYITVGENMCLLDKDYIIYFAKILKEQYTTSFP